MIDKEPHISRVLNSKQETRANYDRLSRWYDWISGPGERRLRAIGVQKLNVTAGDIALEIGFGTGHDLLALAQSVGDSGKVYGIDLSPYMLDITRERVKKAGFAQRVELLCGDAAHLPYRADYFDALFSGFTLELFDTAEIHQVLDKCHRVLKERGRICVVSLSKTGPGTWMRDLYEWGHEHFPRILDCRPIFVQKALEEAGFNIQEAPISSLWGLAVEIVLARK